jgi:hypothetical protein
MTFDELIPLTSIAYDSRARNGEWCCNPYPGHPKGCPNFSKGCTTITDFTKYMDKYLWYAVVEEFDLKSHAAAMKVKHPGWSERQCRNPLYWQGGVRKRLREKAQRLDPKLHEWGHMYHSIPEAAGVDVFQTMHRAEITIDQHPDIVRKVVFVGIQPGGCDE